MNRAQALEIWAPTESPWSPWTKPVLFAFMSEEIPDVLPPDKIPWRVSFQEAALLVDLPGAEGVELGLDLARVGYRPIPLYNACPSPFPPGALELPLPSAHPPTTVDVGPILQALERQTSALRQVALPPSAPPAFLLDAYRSLSRRWADVGCFDNRSFIRESDLPTAAFLQSQGIREVILIQAKPALPHDLRRVLKTWQEGGLTLSRQLTGERWAPQGFVVPKAWWWQAWLDKFFLESGYPLKADGSFGRFAQDTSGQAG